MRVYKFGGASVKSAAAIRNLAGILRERPPGGLVVIVSAMGKTTNALELLTRQWFENNPARNAQFETVASYHRGIALELFGESLAELETHLTALEQILDCYPSQDFDEAYDSIVPFGELCSTAIVAAYLEKEGLGPRLIDARSLIITDRQHREANVDWRATLLAIRSALHKEIKYNFGLVVSQGFIGATEKGIPTTLGREGSDYTAAIFGSIIDVEEVVIWKDVPGLLNADPKVFGETELLSRISYREAIELAYYGATVIHPKTIKPLENKGIPLRVKSFLHPGLEGSLVSSDQDMDGMIPSFILKKNQVLLTLSPRDFSFIDEKVLSAVLQAFAEERIKLNMMQNSAISFSACFDFEAGRFEKVIGRLSADFRVRFNKELELVTVRHYGQELIDSLLHGREVLLEQRSRVTAQFVVK